MIESEKVPSILEDLWCGSSVWCCCNHHVNCHRTIVKQPLTSIFYNDESKVYGECCFDNGYSLCSCRKFRAYKTTTTLTATNQIDKQEFEKLTAAENKEDSNSKERI